jgi:hypothetical protein
MKLGHFTGHIPFQGIGNNIPYIVYNNQYNIFTVYNNQYNILTVYNNQYNTLTVIFHSIGKIRLAGKCYLSERDLGDFSKKLHPIYQCRVHLF